YARGKNTQNQWTGAFVRFAPTDATAPAVPQDLTASSSEGTVQLNWQGVDDATYEVLREDRVVHDRLRLALAARSRRSGPLLRARRGRSGEPLGDLAGGGARGGGSGHTPGDRDPSRRGVDLPL